MGNKNLFDDGLNNDELHLEGIENLEDVMESALDGVEQSAIVGSDEGLRDEFASDLSKESGSDEFFEEEYKDSPDDQSDVFDSADSNMTIDVADSESKAPKKKNKKLIVGVSIVAGLAAILLIGVVFAADIVRSVSPKAYLGLVFSNLSKDLEESNLKEVFISPNEILKNVYDQKVSLSFNSLKLNGEDYSSVAKNVGVVYDSTVDNGNKKISSNVDVNFLVANVLKMNTYVSMDEWVVNIPQVSDKYIAFNPNTFNEDWDKSFFAMYYGLSLPPEFRNFKLTDFTFRDDKKKDIEQISADLVTLFSDYSRFINVKNEGTAMVLAQDTNVKCGKVSLTINKSDLGKLPYRFYNTIKDLMPKAVEALQDNQSTDTTWQNMFFENDLVLNLYADNSFKLVKCDLDTSIKSDSNANAVKVNASTLLLGSKNPTYYMTLDCSLVEQSGTAENANGNFSFTFDKESGVHKVAGNINIPSGLNASYAGTIDSVGADKPYVLNLDNLQIKTKDGFETAAKLKYSLTPAVGKAISQPTEETVRLLEQSSEEQMFFFIEIAMKLEMLGKSFSGNSGVNVENVD